MNKHDLSKLNLEKIEFYNKHYTVEVDRPLIDSNLIKLSDKNINERKCRFCGKSKFEVTFKNRAHAIPEFLGNKSIITMNECDVCNQFFASEYEDHLAKWFGPMRSLCQIQGKHGTPKYKSEKFVAKKGDKGMELFVKADSTLMNLNDGGSGNFKIPVEMETQPYIPIKAAKAFIKAAVSVLPEELLPECEKTILWLLNKANVNFDKFPVFYAFTPGVNPYKNGRAMICKRKSIEMEIPFLWFIIATTNFLFQIMVPFCKSDSWIKFGTENKFNIMYFPTPFTEKYETKIGKTVWYQDDWASNIPIIQNREASFHFDRIEEKHLNKDRTT
ncbi:MAG: hypothetical protein A2X64_02885 [Ignavibacteria bacterium GWF2_33_9]|nr:MAG: hypothetical protein A2X64_02885 [Ignavibacteria bacterium GWF2_33_9]